MVLNYNAKVTQELGRQALIMPSQLEADWLCRLILVLFTPQLFSPMSSLPGSGENCIQLTPLLITQLLPFLPLIQEKTQTQRLPSPVMIAF